MFAFVVQPAVATVATSHLNIYEHGHYFVNLYMHAGGGHRYMHDAHLRYGHMTLVCTFGRGLMGEGAGYGTDLGFQHAFSWISNCLQD